MKQTVSKRVLAVKVLISGAFFWVLISFVQTNQLLRIFARIDWFFLILAFLLTPVMLVVSCLKWKMVLDLDSTRIPFTRLLRIYLIGYFFSNLLPSTVGGDVARSYYSGKLINNQSFAAIAIFIERFSGVILLLFLVILSPLLKPELYQSPYIFLPTLGAVSLLTVIGWIWRVREPLNLPRYLVGLVFSGLYKLVSISRLSKGRQALRVLEKWSQAIFSRAEKLHTELGIAVVTIKKNKLLLVKIILITILFYILTWLNVYLSFMAFGVSPDFLKICSLVPTVLFVAQVPVTLLGNLGFFESVFVFYFLLIGIPGVETLAMGLLLRAKLLVIGGVGYLVYLSYSQAQHLGEEFE